MAFDLLKGTSRTGCQSLIVLITDGKDTDGESVRCGPGKSVYSSSAMSVIHRHVELSY